MHLDELLVVPSSFTPDGEEATIKKLMDMLVLQDRNNKRQHRKDWANCSPIMRPDHRAAYLELAEGLEHIGWGQWWKKAPDVTEEAFKQFQVELIDVLHFQLSMLIRNEGITDYNEFFSRCIEANEEMFEALIYAQNDGAPFRSMFYTTVDSLVGVLGILPSPPIIDVGYTEEDLLQISFEMLFAIMYMSNMTINDIYKMYVGKNVLNGIRNANGYRTGDYLKNWRDNIDAPEGAEYDLKFDKALGGELLPITDCYEDNDYLERLLEEDYTIADLEEKMAVAYKQVLCLHCHFHGQNVGIDDDGSEVWMSTFRNYEITMWIHTNGVHDVKAVPKDDQDS